VPETGILSQVNAATLTPVSSGGIKEFQTGISCVNDISTRLKPKTEEKYPELLAEIRAIMEPHSETESHLRTTLLYTNMTAKAVL